MVLEIPLPSLRPLFSPLHVLPPKLAAEASLLYLFNQLLEDHPVDESDNFLKHWMDLPMKPGLHQLLDQLLDQLQTAR